MRIWIFRITTYAQCRRTNALCLKLYHLKQQKKSTTCATNILIKPQSKADLNQTPNQKEIDHNQKIQDPNSTEDNQNQTNRINRTRSLEHGKQRRKLKNKNQNNTHLRFFQWADSCAAPQHQL